MLLCDIGNTTATFFKDGKIWSEDIAKFRTFNSSEKVYFISVNDNLGDKLSGENFIDLGEFVRFNTTYSGLGIDRAVACLGVETGLIIDAGSAITIDIMSNGVHLGGTILPGLSALIKAVNEISPRLQMPLNTAIDLDCLPQKTSDAISYGVIKPIILLIDELSFDKPIYFTGGDGEFLSRFFKNAIFDRALIFRSMKKIIEGEKLCLE